jgi:flagellar motor switch protein FliN/FliY
MDEEKQPPLDDNEESKQPDVPLEGSAEQSSDDADVDESSSGDDLSMPDMDLTQSESEDESKSQTASEETTSEADAKADASGSEESDESSAQADTPESSEPDESSAQTDGQSSDSKSTNSKQTKPDDWNEDDAEAEMLKVMEKESAGETSTPDESSGMDSSPPVVEKVNFGPLRAEGSSETKNLDMLMDVSLPIAIELGRTSMAIEDILNLGPGSVVELDKLAGEPVDLLINDKLLAKGEVVVIDENFGVRITSMISPQNRIKNLK